ncbi:MAG: hypothetical protein KBD41_07920 [Saprospiraceae bacterium]|nr:hypothetical protein [Saprospiraceae bacterium]
MNISQKLQLPLEEAHSLAKMGYSYLNKNNYSRALKMFLDAISVIDNLSNNFSVLRAQYQAPDEFTDRTQTIEFQKMDKKARILQYLGILYGNYANYNQAIYSFRQALDLSTRTNNKIIQCITYITLGRIFLGNKQKDSALIAGKLSLKLAQDNNYNRYLGSIYLNLGREFIAKDSVSLGIKMIKIAIHHSYKENYLRGVVASSLLLSNLKHENSEMSRLDYLHQAFVEAIKLNSPDLLLRCYTSYNEYFKEKGIKDSIVKYQALIIKTNELLNRSRQDQEFQNIDFAEKIRQQDLIFIKSNFKRQLRWWSILITSILGFFSVFILYRNKKQNEIKASLLNERLRLSRELHDDLGANLSGISMYTHLAQSQFDAKDTSLKKSLDIIRESSSEMVNKLNEIVWLINPDQDHLSNLLDKINDYAVKLCKAKEVKYSFKSTLDLDEYHIPEHKRRNLYLILKEAINNALKYSEATTIDLKITTDKDSILFLLWDNGIGFDVATSGQGNGLRNIEKRAADVHAQVSIKSIKNQGTEILLTLPV